MIVANDISHDTRVLKSGLALTDAGLEVTLLGRSTSSRREESTLGPLRVVRVPVPWTLKEARDDARLRRRRPRLSLELNPAERARHDLRDGLRRRELALDEGRSARLRERLLDARHQGVRSLVEIDRRLGHAERFVWKVVDAAVHRTPVAASWRSELPEIDDYELGMAPAIDRLDWDVIHAHDVQLVGVASHAVARRRRDGRKADWVYDAHEYVAGLSLYGSRTRRRRAAYLDLEREFIGDAGAVVTVTEPLAERLRRDHRLSSRPTVVMNSPELTGPLPESTGVRETLRLAANVPLMVYSGAVTHARGIDTVVAALPDLPGVHLAVVCVPGPHTVVAQQLAAQARKLGCEDRVHLLEPVRPHEVTGFVASADIGLLPLRRFGSHDVALANKLFEYLYAGLPVLVSDCPAQRDFVVEHRVGAVHLAGDVASFTEQARQLLVRRDEVRALIGQTPDLLRPYAWSVQQRSLRQVYRDLFGGERVSEPATTTRLDEVVETTVAHPERPSVVGIGPANMAGQGWEWAKALERTIPGLSTRVICIDRGSPLMYPADTVVPQKQFAGDAEWAAALESDALDTWTHALIEAGRPLFGLRNGRDFTGDARTLRSLGVEVGLLFHGSELRNPRDNALRTRWSPFRDPREALTRRLQQQRDHLFPLIARFDGPVGVSTPDLLLDLPSATWVPVVVDLGRWGTRAPLLERARPRVVHAPSRASLKGSDHVDAALAPLVAEGLIDYQRLENVPPSEMPDCIAGADIVVDQLSIGIYGVAAAEAMAAGRVVVSHVMPEVRALCPEELPVLEATPDDVADVVRRVADDRAAARGTAAAGVEYVRAWHDGRRSATVMRELFGLHGR
ncbi:glycosyltransferase [Knoellia aerolata]|nr:glycosyltransferase [Knoellia aerolata]